MPINEIAALGMDLALEIYAPLSGMKEEEKAAADAAVAGVATVMGAGAIATANAIQVATAVAGAVMDASGVEEDNPLREAVDAGVAAATTVASGGTSGMEMVRLATDLVLRTGAAGAEAAGIEGASALSAVSGALEGNLAKTGVHLGRTAVGAAGSVGGAALGAGLAAAGGSDGAAIMAAAGTGAQLGGRTVGVASKLTGTGAEADAEAQLAQKAGGKGGGPDGSNPSDGAMGIEKPAATKKAITKAQQTLSSQGQSGALDLGVGLAAAAGTQLHAEAQGRADVERSLAVGTRLGVGSMAQGKTRPGIAGAAKASAALAGVVAEGEHAARHRDWADFDARIAGPHAEKASEMRSRAQSWSEPWSSLRKPPRK